MWDIIFIIIAFILFLTAFFIVFKSYRQYRDKSVDIKNGMSEEQVLDIMESDPLSIEQLKNGAYEWIYEKREWKGWGMMVLKIEVQFDSNQHVTAVLKSTSYEKTSNK